MRPTVKVLLKNRSDFDGSEQKAWVPLPLPTDCMKAALYADRLGISGAGQADSRKDEIIAYRSIFGVAPLPETPTVEVEFITDIICRFSVEQLECINMMLRVFHMEFMDIDGFIDFLCAAKHLTRCDVMQNGIPVLINNYEKEEGENDNG